MDINRQTIDALFKTFMTAWAQGLQHPMPIDLSFMTTEFPSMTASNFYAWMDLIPGFREWVGDRVFHDVRSNKHEVVNRDWEDSVTMPAKDIYDDQYGVYAPIISMMGAAWPQLLHEIRIDVLLSNPKAFTGKDYFATTHKYGKNTISNKVTDALTADTFNAAFTTAAGWYFSNGKPCRTRFTHLLHGPALRATAFNLVDNSKIASDSVAVDNPNYKRVERVEIEDFVGTYANYWMLLDCSRPIKPVCLQRRKEPSPKMDTDMDQIEKSGKIDFFADGRAAAAPTFPHLVYGGLATA